MMILPPNVVASPEEFERISKLVCEVVDTNKRLPDFVFREQFKTFCFVEFARVFGGPFTCILDFLKKYYHDDEVFLYVVEPDAKDYYWDRYSFGYFGAAKFTGEITSDSYWQTVSVSSKPKGLLAHPAYPDAIAYTGDIVAWTGTSGRWAIWGEREFGVGIIGFLEPPPYFDFKEEQVPLFDFEEMLRVMALEFSAYYEKRPEFRKIQESKGQKYDRELFWAWIKQHGYELIPKAFTEKFRANYNR